MSTPTESYRSVFYDLRPAKQIERRIFLEVMQGLSEVGFPIRDYRYLGMGSIYFVDFILLHRLLGMRDLTSVEIAESARRRVQFNRPYADIKVEIGPIGNVLGSIDRDQRHLVWLDYDHRLGVDDIQDVVLAASVVARGSVLLITVELEPPKGETEPAQWKRYYDVVAKDLMPLGVGVAEFARSNLGGVVGQIVVNAIKRGISGRPSMKYIPLCAIVYADGREMLTIGGMIGSESDEASLRSCKTLRGEFVVSAEDVPPTKVEVPRLTRKERMFLDQHMPCADGWVPSEFDLPDGDVERYRRIYRYYPIYGELMF